MLTVSMHTDGRRSVGVQGSVGIMRATKPRQTPFAIWLENAREAKGLSMRALGEIADVTHAHISKLESGGQPSRDMVQRLAAALSGPDADERTADALLRDGMRAAGFLVTERPEIEYIADPELRTLIETYEDADDDGKAVIWHGVEQAKRIKSALSASRSGAFGERKDD